jgi:hypothetical protein
VFSQQARSDIVVATQDAEHDVFTPDPIVLVRE